MSKYKHVIFDIDGTLLDTEYAILQSLKNTVAEMLQKDLAIEKLKFALGIPGEVTLRRLGIPDTGTANRRWNEYLLKYKSGIRPFEGIPALLTSLKAGGYSLGIVTSKDRKEYKEDFVSVFLSSVSPNNNFNEKIGELLSKFPSIDITAMGFCQDWKDESMWI